MILGRGVAAAFVATASISSPVVHAFVAETASPPRAATARRLAVATTPRGTDRDDRIATLESRLEEATSEAARWRDECARAQLDAAASIDGLRAEYDAALEESQSLIDSLLREAALREEDDDVEISFEKNDGGADDANLEWPLTAEAESFGGAKEGEGKISLEVDAAANKLWFAAEAKDSVGAEESQESTGSHSPVDDAASTSAVVAAPAVFPSKEEGSDSIRRPSEEDLELTRRVIMDFVKLGGGDGDEDAFVLSKRGNVEYLEKIENRSRRRMSLRERLMAMETAGSANGSVKGKALVAVPSPQPRAPPRVPGSSRRMERVGSRRGAEKPSERTGTGSAPRKTTSLRELVLRS